MGCTQGQPVDAPDAPTTAPELPNRPDNGTPTVAFGESAALKQPSRISIIIAGAGTTGKSSFARRFVAKQFDADAPPFTRGVRTIAVNDSNVDVELININCASAEEVRNADGIVYTVRGDIDCPFSGLYKYMDAVEHDEVHELIEVGLQPVRFDDTPNSIPFGAMPAVAPPGSIGSMSDYEDGDEDDTPKEQAPRTAAVASRDSIRGGDECLTAGAGAGAGAGGGRGGAAAGAGIGAVVDGVSASIGVDASSNRSVVFGSLSDDGSALVAGRPRGSCLSPSHSGALQHSVSNMSAPSAGGRRAVYSKLRVSMGSNAPASMSFRKTKSSGSGLSDRPTAVVVTRCDIVDACAADNPQGVVRLRAMANNWSSANRCRVTFVSSKTGVGVNSALAHLIKRIYARFAMMNRASPGL